MRYAYNMNSINYEFWEKSVLKMMICLVIPGSLNRGDNYGMVTTEVHNIHNTINSIIMFTNIKYYFRIYEVLLLAIQHFTKVSLNKQAQIILLWLKSKILKVLFR